MLATMFSSSMGPGGAAGSAPLPSARPAPHRRAAPRPPARSPPMPAHAPPAPRSHWSSPPGSLASSSESMHSRWLRGGRVCGRAGRGERNTRHSAAIGEALPGRGSGCLLEDEVSLRERSRRSGNRLDERQRLPPQREALLPRHLIGCGAATPLLTGL